MKKILAILAAFFALKGYSQTCNQSALVPMHTFTYGTIGVNSYTEATQTFYICSNAEIYDTLASNISGICRFGIVTPGGRYTVKSKGCGTIYALNTSTVIIAPNSTIACNIVYEPGAAIVNQSTLTLNTFTCASITIPSNINCSLVTGLNDLKSTSSALNLFPNPATDNLTLDNLSGTINNVEIEITNLLGAIVYKTTCSGEKIKLDLNGLNNGIYYLSVNSTEIKETRKIVIAK